MWSLPDINRLNSTAAANASRLRREARRKRKPRCEYSGCDHSAAVSHLVFHIFSDDPKSSLHLCERHDGHSGTPMEGYFTCAGCDRVMVENYTWELYSITDGEEQLCLKCAADGHFADERSWIHPSTVIQVVLEPGDGPLFDYRTGTLNLARCPHVLGVGQPVPKGVKFVENAEFDACTGRQISGRNVAVMIHELGEPFVPVLDAAYQFAVSIGLYVRAGRKSGRARRACRRPGHVDAVCSASLPLLQEAPHE